MRVFIWPAGIILFGIILNCSSKPANHSRPSVQECREFFDDCMDNAKYHGDEICFQRWSKCVVAR
jgi:hypothetical protein